MTLDEAVAEVERGLDVSTDRGWTDPDTKQVDLNRAPDGSPIVILTSGGVRRDRDQQPAWFARKDDAVRAWLAEAWSYLERRGGTKLWWIERPQWFETEFVAVDQSAMLNTLAGARSIVIQVGTIEARLAVSRAVKGEGKQE